MTPRRPSSFFAAFLCVRARCRRRCCYYYFSLVGAKTKLTPITSPHTNITATLTLTTEYIHTYTLLQSASVSFNLTGMRRECCAYMHTMQWNRRVLVVVAHWESHNVYVCVRVRLRALCIFSSFLYEGRDAMGWVGA